ncbi:hypothetical protein EV361DRAFT_869020 [Lentinula raphanica]|nr:hypothetical protein EV360DRAFT_74258 [Lentinula raphanica]KAJ3827719.1 hypothetical protein F5880DRAFT_1503637 [Lentinula raphanica]KAJ3970787.1 hypothetical protein EV361DRAFT_869020 [Lentinula raphanica]
MIFKPIALLASLSIFSMASAWEIFMYESTAGGDPDNCNGGGTTVSGTGSVCQLAAPNTVAMQVINDPEGCELLAAAAWSDKTVFASTLETQFPLGFFVNF